MLPLEPPQQPVNLATPHETIVQEALPDRGQHRHRRLFVGPMPEKVISQTQLQGRSNRRRGWFYTSSETPTSDEVDASMSRAIKDHAFKFFLHHGGKAEDWGENEERNTTEDMIRRWKSSEWGKIWSRKEKLQSSRWVGSTFEIGSFLGVSLFVKDPLPERTEDNESSHIATSITSWTTPDTGASTVAETSGSASYKPLGHQHHTLENGQSRGGNSRPPIDNRLITPSSSTALLRPPIGSSISGKARNE
jgi:hypothetical protein